MNVSWHGYHDYVNQEEDAPNLTASRWRNGASEAVATWLRGGSWYRAGDIAALTAPVTLGSALRFCLARA